MEKRTIGYSQIAGKSTAITHKHERSKSYSSNAQGGARERDVEASF